LSNVHHSLPIVGSVNSTSYLSLPNIFPTTVVALYYDRGQLCTSLATFLTPTHYQLFFFLVAPFFIFYLWVRGSIA